MKWRVKRKAKRSTSQRRKIIKATLTVDKLSDECKTCISRNMGSIAGFTDLHCRDQAVNVHKYFNTPMMVSFK